MRLSLEVQRGLNMLKKIDNTCPYSLGNKFLLGLICIFFILFFIPIVVWSFIQILGHAEWVLRLPSLLSLILACIFLYQLCLALFDRECALFSILCFICLLQLPMTDVANDARPYGLAVMFSTLSILCFIKWIQTGRTKHQIAYIIISKVSGSSIFVNRYYCWSYPAIALVVSRACENVKQSRIKVNYHFDLPCCFNIYEYCLLSDAND